MYLMLVKGKVRMKGSFSSFHNLLFPDIFSLFLFLSTSHLQVGISPSYDKVQYL